MTNFSVKEAPLIFVHGFLGQPSDWSLLQNTLREKTNRPFVNISVWDLVDTEASLQRLASQIANVCQEGSIIIGYSLGGRILMHLPQDVLSKCEQVILISSHIGFEKEAEIAHRRIADQSWTDDFLHLPWSELMEKWNRQSIFDHDRLRPDRLEAEYSRTKLAAALVGCSLAEQQIWGGFPPAYFSKVTHIVGELDSKYLAMQTHFKKQFHGPKYMTIEGMGHYGLSSHAIELSDKISSFFPHGAKIP